MMPPGALLPPQMQQQFPPGGPPQQQQQQPPQQQQQPSSSPAAAVPAKTAWTEHTAPDGRKYYYNSGTKASTYEKPAELLSPQVRARGGGRGGQGCPGGSGEFGSACPNELGSFFARSHSRRVGVGDFKHPG